MARPTLAFAVVLLAFASGPVSAEPTATWQGVTDTLVCVDGGCRILTPPVDDARVNVGTGSSRELRLSLDSGTETPLALQFEEDGRSIRTPSREFQRTAWLPAPADRILEVEVLDLAFEPTGVREGVPFTLKVEYR
jgi:hypothetical protein